MTIYESWRDCVRRYASSFGLEQECLEHFDRARADGTPENQAAWEALYEWDVLDFDAKKGELVVTRQTKEVEE